MSGAQPGPVLEARHLWVFFWKEALLFDASCQQSSEYGANHLSHDVEHPLAAIHLAGDQKSRGHGRIEHTATRLGCAQSSVR